MLLRVAERRDSCWSTAGQRHAIFKDDLEGLRGSTLQRPTLMMSSLSDWHSTRAETSRTRPDTSMAMTLTGMATVRPVSMAVLMISVSCREAVVGGALLSAFPQRYACHPLLPLLRYPLLLRKWHMCARVCLCPAPGSPQMISPDRLLQKPSLLSGNIHPVP